MYARSVHNTLVETAKDCVVHHEETDDAIFLVWNKKMKRTESFFFLAIFLLCLLLVYTNKEEYGGGTEKTLELWQNCDLFLAPSSTGWGVFAARDFAEGELVDAAPLVIRTWDDRHDGISKGTVLDDYVYGYIDDPTEKISPAVLFGYSMFFNHHPEPNVLVSESVVQPIPIHVDWC